MALGAGDVDDDPALVGFIVAEQPDLGLVCGTALKLVEMLRLDLDVGDDGTGLFNAAGSAALSPLRHTCEAKCGC